MWTQVNFTKLIQIKRLDSSVLKLLEFDQREIQNRIIQVRNKIKV